MAAYRPPGRSGRSGRSQADNDIFEGLPVKQWSTMPSRVLLAPPPSETDMKKAHDKWADPAMPENSQLLLPHTQQLLRIARSGKYGTKRKAAPDPEADGDDFNAREEEGLPDELLAKPPQAEEKGFIARKWRHVPESALVPEHLHWEFLAKRRKGLPSFYHGAATEVSTSGIPQIAKRKTRVQRVLDPATGESAIYEVLALEGQVLENELPSDSQMQAIHLEPGTTIEGLGVANEEGLISLVPANPAPQSRRNRPPPKKKGGPGRGKKRVTFTNPDGSTYTTIVPNATKIVAQPGQTVKHVAKGEDASKDVSMEEAARQTNDGDDGGEQGEGNEDGDDDDDEGEDGDEGDDDDDDNREDAEIQQDAGEVTTLAPSVMPPIEAPIETHEPLPTTSPLAHIPAPAEAVVQIEGTPDQVHISEANTHVDVEMEDQSAIGAAEAHTRAEPEPEQSELRTGSQSPANPSTEPAEGESSRPEAAPVDDAMDIEPEGTLALAPTPAPEIVSLKPAEDIHISLPESEGKAPETAAEQSSLTSENGQPSAAAGGLHVEAATDLPTEAQPGGIAESAIDEQTQDPPVQRFEDGDEDLLGSLERSLGD